MNCQEVIDILDNQKLDQLDPALRRQAGAHVALCVECARAWHLQDGLAALPGIAMPEDFAAMCRRQVAANTRGTRVAGSRVVIVGALVALAAAAAVSTLLPQASAPVSVDAAAQPELAVADVEAERALPAQAEQEEEPAPQSSASAATPVAPARQVVVQLMPLQVPPNLSGDAAAVPEAGRELFLEQQNLYTEPSRKQALQALHAAVRQELLAIPGLRLVDGDPAELAPGSRGYRLRINPVTMTEVNGRVIRDDARLLMSISEQQSPAAKEQRRPWFTSAAITLHADCSGAASAGAPPCMDARTVAADMVRKMRQELLPPDAAQVQALQASFGDASRDPALRAGDLSAIVDLQDRTGDDGMLRDAAVVLAAIQLAATGTPDIRARVWRGMRGSGAAELIEPMTTSLQQDADEVRLAALETLVADFAADPRARAALQAAANQDARPLLRAVAQRGLTGEQPWRQYMLASLANTELPPAARLEALLYDLYPANPKALSSDGYWEILKGLDANAVRAVADTLPIAGKVSSGNNFLGNFAATHRQYPEVTTMLLRVLQDHPLPLYRRVAVETLIGSRNTDPRVKPALAAALENDPDQQVRDHIRRLQR